MNREDYLGTKCAYKLIVKKYVREMHAANDAKKLNYEIPMAKNLKTTTVHHVYNAECNLFIRC